MTRAQQTISIFLLATSRANLRETSKQLYLCLYLQLVPLPDVIQTEVIPVLPFWVLVSFGALLLGRLGWGVLTFNDTPEAHKELLLEIEEAKKDLRRLGVTVD
ncbi:uncharacterized protein PpBr36_10280 [Pyricularia pennisetigena]|uniref:uncharacterized protein n=1 Tax=Pyricularia pennisetigena TaxID=1578925 RepID=UPI00114FACB5|nr:uncharacterized protein PpBr36_10280 [Pyricularia pennisetigena]TLS21413.1 hypothetical protein PpBr36_10280 [Pyricularia pennisetigena]